MDDPLHPAAAFGQVEIGVEDAAAIGPLQLGSGAFAHLEAWLAEAAGEIAGGQADEDAAGPLDGGRGRAGRGPRRPGAGGDEGQDGKGKQAAHRFVMAAAKLAGKRPDG